ncbi:MAG: spherulation-specific family 4 protein [Thaumarchaeota archaeon]|nr:spherulation-specific family 4 protein [Nitrososphaerota archaeon]
MIFIFLSLSVISAQHIGTAATPTAGLLVPLYTYPTDSSWQTLIQAKLANPSVPVAAIINPSNGPGSGQDSNFVQGINSLRSAGISVLGYVATGYGSVSVSSAESQINAYKQWYNVNGILFDEMNNVPGYESYYSTLSNYAYSLGFSWTVGNPGAPVPASYIGTVGTIIIYENAGLPSLSLLSSATGGYSPSNFAFTAYAVSSLDPSYISSAESYVSWMYITDGTLPNPYGVLPSYLSSLMADLSTGASSTTTTTTTTSQTVPVTIQSVDQNGAPINGLYTMVQSTSGAVLDTGYTPLTYSATTGNQYVVTADGYGSYVFSQWSTGSTSATITISATQSMTLTAYYQNTQSTTTTTTSQTVPVTIQSVDQNGAPINGLYAVIQSSTGSTLATGFTPMTYYATAGQQYTISVSNYGSYYFSQWSNGVTSRSITITPTQSTSLTAVYSTSGQSPPVLTIESQYSNGTPILGLYSVVESSSNVILSTGFTTFTYVGAAGATYTVAVADYGTHHFIQWSNGSTNRFLTLSLGQSTTLIAYFT